MVEVGVPDVRLGKLWEVGLVDRLGRAGVALGDSVRLRIFQGLPCPGAPGPWGRSTRFQGLWLSRARRSATLVAGEVLASVGIRLVVG